MTEVIGKSKDAADVTKVKPDDPLNVIEEDQPQTKLEQIQAKQQNLEEIKKKSMDAWGDSGESKQFGLSFALKFIFPKLYQGSCFQKLMFTLNYLAIPVTKAAQVLSPLILKYAVDGILCDRSVKDNTCNTEEETYMLIGAYGLFKLAYDILNSLREIPYARMAATAETTIAHDVYDHVQRLSLAYHLSRETGKMIRMVSRGSQGFERVLRMLTFNIVPIFIEIAMVLIIYVVLFSWQFFLIQIFFFFLYTYAIYKLTEKVQAPRFKAKYAADSRYNQVATDGLLNFETVKYFNAEEHEAVRFELQLQKYQKEVINVSRGAVFISSMKDSIINIGLLSVLLLAQYHVSEKTLTPGDFVMFITYNMQIYMPLSFLGFLWQQIRENMVSVEQVLNLLEINEKIPEASDPIACTIDKGKIEFKNVSFTYDGKLPKEEQTIVIENLSFEIEPGTSVGIVGQTGSGKSTIMRLLYRFYDLLEGQILIDGVDISKCRLYELRDKIAIVPQDCVLFNDSILYNIAYGGLSNEEVSKRLDDPTKDEELLDLILPASKMSQLHPFIMNLKRGYWDMVGERGLRLSGGEKQRVAIARALLKRSPIMLFDEATSALDNDTERQVQEAIEVVSKGATSLIIAHRLTTVKKCDKIIVLKHGLIVEQGSHDELLQIEDGHYQSMWLKQTKKLEDQ